MPEHDQLYRYLFSQRDIRGELVSVAACWRQILKPHHYPPPVQTLLGELLVATCLLSATLKFAGTITVQLQGDGPVSLMVINGDHQQHMRGVARIRGDIPAGASLKNLLGNGVMVITLAPENGERYQGVVALEADSLAACLEAYFLQSEQLATRLFIHSGEHQGQPVAAGILLQALPTQRNHHDDMNHLAALTQTITFQELATLPAQDILWRLYHEEHVTLYPPQNIRFQCTCSRQRCADALLTLPRQHIEDMLTEKGEINMHCDYCGTDYIFTPQQLTALPPEN